MLASLSMMMSHGFKSSKQDFTFGPWKVTAAKNHIMKSKDIERLAEEMNMPSLPEMMFGDNVLRIQHTDGYGIEFNAIDALKRVNNMEDAVKVACAQEWQESRADTEHSKEVLRPYDWTYTTDYRGTLIGDSMQIKVTETTERINMEKLKAREHIMFFDEVLLFEDELHDHGVSMISVKIRVMPTSFFLLLRFFLRVDGVLIRINDTRLYYEAGKDYMLREFSTRESKVAELKFLKSEADLDYIEKWLKLDFMNAGENGCPVEENPVMMLENLKVIKAKHSALCTQVKDIAAAQKESMDSIRNNLNSAMELIQHFQQTTDVKVPTQTVYRGFPTYVKVSFLLIYVEALTMSETNSAALLDSAVCQNTSEESSGVAASHKQQSHSCGYEELSVSMLDTVPLSIRSNIELTDLNAFYKQLQEHLSRSDSGSLSLQKMKQLKMKPSDAKLKILQHLSLVELDRKGLLRLI
ncbi:TIP41-like protein isoform X4 [Acanthochromis polyacanthus]|uniref:TIP41-like protein isoform X4 n=1 Tax=Acanthochromis polyacanthus TaxID=80966 RepID=UPI00223424DF|nr:TIP41-like protein isoform X4 [Acanthochromis polyacanthus]